MTTDYRALCAELADALNELSLFVEAQSPVPVVTKAIKAWNKARAALAQPDPVGPTDEAIDQIYWDESWRAETDYQSAINEVGLAEFRLIARAVLQRWGCSTPQPPSDHL